MRRSDWLIGAVLMVCPGLAWADVPPMPPPTLDPLPQAQPADPLSGAAAAPLVIRPVTLSVPEPESVYPPPSAAPLNEGENEGAMHYHLEVSFLNRYVYRGVDQTPIPYRSENPLQFNGTAEMDLGNLPHPFVGLFSNIFDHDPVSRFEEVRPYVGARWTIKPLTISGGYNDYIFPNREKTSDTQEGFASLGLDDSRIWNTEQPILSPYIYGAYDFARYHGAYMEVGIRHDFVIGDSGVTLSPQGEVAYVIKDHYFLRAPHTLDSGWQHYEVGMVGSYLINEGLNFPKRYGTWKVVGYLFYDDGLQTRIRADSRLWGGVGLSFDY
ncbi:MAG TPA: hypothetical protein VHY37_11145 [Tepidisphaeraceae bacterium]|jgi:hypothetical protein|nr:hypothetical protein [Tepidisphaeraceae bacterium]